MQFLSFWRKGVASRASVAGARAAVMVILSAVLMGAAPGLAEAKPKFAAITVDARNGNVLYAENADGIRYPASLTKMMTLYVLFQDLKNGKIKLNSPIRMSARAAAMAPSKLGVRAGQSIPVETAIKALVVKSANDVAAAVAENLGGTEAAFAARMTRTARALGMSRTTYANASGLPNAAQVTTARDQATLGLRLMRDFPQYYPYFRTQNFSYNGRTILGHNRLLGRYDGTDGIKTGYVNASGFNLVTSVRRGDKRLVGVVLGGRSGGSRDAYMKTMLTKHFRGAANGRMIAALPGSSTGARDPVATAQTAQAAAENKKAKGSLFGRKKKEEAPPNPEVAIAEATAVTPEQGDTGEDQAGEQAGTPPESTPVEVVAEPEPELQPELPRIVKSGLVDPAMPAKLPFQVKTPSDQMADQTAVAAIADDTSWIIYLGDYATKQDAQAHLQRLRKKAAAVLGGKNAQTVVVQKGAGISYRARFSGFSEESAKAACQLIRKNKSPCSVQAPA